MKIAIIGGGASGIVCAHLLCKTHEVTVFEKEPTLGGNIQTINLNAASSHLDKNIIIENGVTGFHTFAQPTFRKLISSLSIPMKLMMSNAASSLFLNHGRYYEVPSFYTLKKHGLSHFIKKYLELSHFSLEMFQVSKKLQMFSSIKSSDVLTDSLSTISSDFGVWLKCSAMIAFSTPYENLDSFPSYKLGELMKNYLLPSYWCIPGGVYSYIQKILTLNKTHLNYHCNTHIASIERTNNKVTLTFINGERRGFDKVIFATPASSVLSLLEKPTEREIDYFQHWRSRAFKTIAHKDHGLYQRYHAASKTPADYFIKPDGNFGYNTFINHIYKLPYQVPYSFAYNLEEYIDKDSILSKHTHSVPIYEEKSYQYREKIIALSGQNNTLFIGAYLTDGLQEGASYTALLASKLLGGKTIF